jgi:tRNA threonylcarbamoyladenosine modification (KEOPS) complex Cgi121 subunit
MVHVASINGSPYVTAITGIKYALIKDIDQTIIQTRSNISPSLFQFFNADLIAGWQHLYFAAINAVNAFKTGVNISKNLEVETLLYATGQDQINKGFQMLGISKATSRVALLVISEERETVHLLCENTAKEIGIIDDKVLTINEEKYEKLMEVFEFNEKSIQAVGGDRFEALSNLIIEKGALLPFRR